METQEAEIQVTEEERVFMHRFGCFLRLGYSRDESEVLALSAVDHHEVSNLIGKGASREAAARICM
jgi:hypothetical protein